MTYNFGNWLIKINPIAIGIFHLSIISNSGYTSTFDLLPNGAILEYLPHTNISYPSIHHRFPKRLCCHIAIVKAALLNQLAIQLSKDTPNLAFNSVDPKDTDFLSLPDSDKAAITSTAIDRNPTDDFIQR
jgi:hypothetical protein